MSLPFFGLDIGYSAAIACAIPLVVVAVHLVPYLVDRHGMRSIPGPWLAKFTDVWLGRVAARGHRSDVIRELHRKYGTFVRLSPNHVSIADPNAFKVVYAHGTGGLKADFYDAAVPTRPNTFSTRNRADHTRKRKIVSHSFSLKSVLEYEHCFHLHAGELVRQLDKLAEGGKKGLSGTEGEGWYGRDGRVWCDSLPWYTYITFDIISDLAFGSPFGMLKIGTDVLPLAKPPVDGGEKGDVEYFPIFKVVHEHGYYGAALGVLPRWIWPILKKFHPWFRAGRATSASIAKVASIVVSQRFETPSDRVDILNKLMQGKDEEGKTMGRPELIGEALGYLNAGAGTISGTSCAITHYLCQNPAAQSKLQAELDEALGHDDDPVATWEATKSLPYLGAVINEGIRCFGPFSLGLPRDTPEGGLYVSGKFFPEGTVLGVPIYAIHQDPDLWGNDAEEFRPERWFELDQAKIQEIFYPFSYGPRACLARNFVTVALRIYIATVLRRYTFVLEDPNEKLGTREGISRRPTSSRVGMKRRDV